MQKMSKMTTLVIICYFQALKLVRKVKNKHQILFCEKFKGVIFYLHFLKFTRKCKRVTKTDHFQ